MRWDLCSCCWKVGTSNSQLVGKPPPPPTLHTALNWWKPWISWIPGIPRIPVSPSAPCSNVPDIIWNTILVKQILSLSRDCQSCCALVNRRSFSHCPIIVLSSTWKSSVLICKQNCSWLRYIFIAWKHFTVTSVVLVKFQFFKCLDSFVIYKHNCSWLHVSLFPNDICTQGICLLLETKTLNSYISCVSYKHVPIFQSQHLSHTNKTLDVWQA